jgi:hypothetical protein
VSPPDKAELENMTLSVVIPQKCNNFVIRLHVSLLVFVSVAANCIESVCVDLTNAFQLFPYTLPFN